MRLAAIDVGSNSVHMVVADVTRGHLVVVDRVKEMVRLGRRVFLTGRLTAESMDLASRALRHFQQVAQARHVKRLRVVATSAVREAANRSVFLKRIRRETGLRVEVISGQEEARLIFNAARYALGLDGGPHLLLDVGGGSIELVLVREGRPLWLRSFPLGAARLAERFLTSDPPRSAEVAALTAHLKRELAQVLNDARRLGVTRTIGTSGTVNSLVAMVRAERGERPRPAPLRERGRGRNRPPEKPFARMRRVRARRAARRRREAGRPDAGGGDPGQFHFVADRFARTGGVLVGPARRRAARASPA